MSAYSPTLMIQTAAAEQTPVPQILMDIIGQPMDYSDPENPVPAVPAHIADYFKNYRDQLPVVESSMPIRVAGDKTIMFPEGYTEEYMFPYMMSDRIPGATEKEKQENRDTVKGIFASMTSAHGANGLVQYLSTAPEKRAYISLITESDI
jgi:hypothetical protein